MPVRSLKNHLTEELASAEMIGAALRARVPAAHTVTVHPPGSIEISVHPARMNDVECSSTHRTEYVKQCLALDDRELWRALAGRCQECEHSAVCHVA